MSEKQAALWVLLCDPAGAARLMQDGGEASQDFTDYAGFGTVPQQGIAEAGERYQFTGYVAKEKGKVEHEFLLPTGHCPCCTNQAVGRWLIDDPVGFAAADGNLFRYAVPAEQREPGVSESENT